jgi:putative component of membrane protein insertase Oxa1/YidC/SpoIIIJ protein YidD
MTLAKGSFGSLFFFVCFLWTALPALAEEPFEPGEGTPPPLCQSIPGPSVATRLLDFYQNVLEYNTIHRCLFYTSCSHFAKEQVEKRGWVVGTLYFIDRYFYRENLTAFALYPLKKNKDGVYKLDDDYFLEN